MLGEWIKRGRPEAPVVVFVHGFLSDSEACWRHSNGGSWPEIVASDATLNDVGVWAFTYRTGIFSGHYRLGDAVDALKEHLELDGIPTRSGIVFVCHSMGGLVVRKYLVSRAADLIDCNVPVALFLVASPSLGSDYANWLSPIGRVLKHSQADALRFSQSNAWLADLDREFRNLKEQGRLPLVGKELIEDQFVAFRLLWRKQIVEPFAGACYFGEPFKVPFSDHFTIAKIENSDAIQHRLLRRFILQWRGELAGNALTASDSKGPKPQHLAVEAATICSQEEGRRHLLQAAQEPARNISSAVPLERSGTQRTRTPLEITQMRLVSAGFRVAVDGLLGPQTTEALVAFQRAKVLKVTGLVDPPTEKALRASQERFKIVQERLIVLGYAVGVDGLCGRLTTGALKNFQMEHSLPVTGLADDMTRRLLRSLTSHD